MSEEIEIKINGKFRKYYFEKSISSEDFLEVKNLLYKNALKDRITILEGFIDWIEDKSLHVYGPGFENRDGSINQGYQFTQRDLGKLIQEYLNTLP